MKTIKGENLMIFVKEGDLYGNASTALIALGFATSCNLDVTIDEFDSTSKDSGSWKASVPGMKSWTMSSDNLYCPVYDKLLALALARTTIKLYWIPANNTEALNEVSHTPSLSVNGDTYKYYSGDAWINSVSATAPNADNSNYTVNFTGTGPLTPSDTLPSAGIGATKDQITLAQGASTTAVITGATGTLTATTSDAKVTATISNGVVTIAAAADAPAGAYTVTIQDAGTSTKTYVFVVVSA